MVRMAPLSAMRFDFQGSSAATEVTFHDSVESIDADCALVFVDSAVASIYGGRLPLRGEVAELPGGEGSKNPENLIWIWERMARAGVRRDSTVTVIGGGTVCDVCAFAASTWKRGVRLNLVPTTLLCMVDASLGGKTAVNVGGKKNQAGTFHPAERIMIWPGFLQSLSRGELLNGMAEALKTAVIGNRRIAEHLARENWKEAVRECIAVKGSIVQEDLMETGRRKLLNLGHTVGHCIESASSYRISHGAAVAMGIPVAAEMGGFHGFAEDFRRTAEKLGLGTEIPSSIGLDDILSGLSSDKKTTASGRIWVMPEDWEHCVLKELSAEEELDLLEKAWPR